jgi:hypothetical protein
MVEVGGVEPPSESALPETSPGAGGYFTDLKSVVPVTRGKPTRPIVSVASLCMVRAKLSVRTDATNRRPTSGPWPFQRGREAVKRLPVQKNRCSLIYKGCPF